MKTRVLAIGLDATSPALIARWTADGTMPNLRALIERGMSGSVHGVDGFYVGSTWPSLYTGVGPSRHGVHYELQLGRETYDLTRVQHGEFVRAEPVWSVLSRRGKRVAALDVPLGAPLPDINGVQVVDWGGHDVFFGLRTSPPELRDWLLEGYGGHPHGPSCDVRREGIDDYRTFIDRQVGAVATKASWTRELLDRGGWDLFLQVFTEGHCVGHQCYHLHDPSHPAHDPEMAAELGDPLRRTYAALDEAVGELVAGAGDAYVMAFAGHGMSYWRGAHFLLPDLLERLGVYARPPRPSDPRTLALRGARAVWSRMPEPARRPIRRLARSPAGEREPGEGPPDDLELPARTASIPPLPVDPAASMCFPVPNGTAASGIRLNLVGREPAGRLAPADVDGFCAELTESLLEITDDRTGGPLVRRVIRTSREFPGPYVDRLPDLLVEWSDDVPTGSAIVGQGAGCRVAVRSPRIGALEGVNEFGRTGAHRPTGWFALAGPDVRRGRSAAGISVYDVAPTLAALTGTELSDTDGRSAAVLRPAPTDGVSGA